LFKGNKYILVITEYLTRLCEVTPLPNNSTKTIAKALLHKLVFNHGCPEQLLSDQGKQFHDEIMRTWTQFLGINQLFTSPYHPQTNGLTERLNKTIKQIITTFVDPLHQDWDDILPFTVHAYNTSVQAST
jgi:transposase InsO family protein